MNPPPLKTLQITSPSPTGIVTITLNNPTHRNALTSDFFTSFPTIITSLSTNPDVSVIIILGSGSHFCSGIDVSTLRSLTNNSEFEKLDRGRVGELLRRQIKALQSAISVLEECRKVVVVGVNGACIGGGIDLITACDIRYCTEDAFFSVKEVDLGLAADLGTLQRLPGIVGYGNAVELALTGRRFDGREAKEMGLVSKVFKTKKELDDGIRAVAEGIAAKSPMAVIGTKEVLLRTRDMSLDQGLDYVATWNSSMLMSDDLTESISAQMQKRKPVFAKL